MPGNFYCKYKFHHLWQFQHDPLYPNCISQNKQMVISRNASIQISFKNKSDSLNSLISLYSKNSGIFEKMSVVILSKFQWKGKIHLKFWVLALDLPVCLQLKATNIYILNIVSTLKICKIFLTNIFVLQHKV